MSDARHPSSEVKVGGVYRHTQVGWLSLVLLGGAVALVVGLESRREGSPALLVAGVLSMSACLVIFSALTVVADERGIAVLLGPGLVARRFPWSAIESSALVRNSPLMGWGIRWLGDGWLFNVSGLDAVELRLRDGRRYRVGTDDAAGLHSFIRARLPRPPRT